MDRRTFLELIGWISFSLAAPFFPQKASGSPKKVSKNAQDQERLALMQNIRTQSERFDLRSYYESAKRFLPVSITDSLDGIIAQAAPGLNGVDLGKLLYLHMVRNDGSYTKGLTDVRDTVKGIVNVGLSYVCSLVPPEQRTTPASEQLYRMKLRELRDDIITNKLGITLGRIRDHVAQYPASDLAIVYPNMTNVTEVVQAYFHEPFSLFVQLAFGKRGTVFWPTVTNDTFDCIEAAFKDPHYQDLAVIGHGDWSSVALGGVAEEPENALIKIIQAYLSDPQQAVDAVTDAFLFPGALAALGVVTQRGAVHQFDGRLAVIHNLSGDNEQDDIVADRNFAMKKKGALVKYTCGTARYSYKVPSFAYPPVPLFDPLSLTANSPLEAMMFFCSPASQPTHNGFSALSPEYVGQYEQQLMHEFAAALPEYASKVTTNPLNFHGIREQPLFGTTLMRDPRKVYAYEGITWISDFLREPFPVVQHHFKI